jgi:hypothetical protein
MSNITIANKAKFGTEGNHSEFEDDGTMKFHYQIDTVGSRSEYTK